MPQSWFWGACLVGDCDCRGGLLLGYCSVGLLRHDVVHLVHRLEHVASLLPRQISFNSGPSQAAWPSSTLLTHVSATMPQLVHGACLCRPMFEVPDWLGRVGEAVSSVRSMEWTESCRSRCRAGTSPSVRSMVSNIGATRLQIATLHVACQAIQALLFQ